MRDSRATWILSVFLGFMGLTSTARAEYDVCSPSAPLYVKDPNHRIVALSVDHLRPSDFPTTILVAAQKVTNDGVLPDNVKLEVSINPETPSSVVRSISLLDDGSNGDLRSGDGIYSAQVSFDSAPMAIATKVTATFKTKSCTVPGPTIDVVASGECLGAVKELSNAFRQGNRAKALSYFVWNGEGTKTIMAFTDAQLPSFAKAFDTAEVTDDDGTRCQIRVQSVNRKNEPVYWNLRLGRMSGIGWQVTSWE